MVRWVVFLMFFTVLKSSFSQVVSDFTETDRLTYGYYVSEKWDSLILIGEKALKSNLDYFYLRARLGTAYMAKGNYAKAAYHFRKAMDFNSSDKYTAKSLLMCYNYLNRNSESNFIKKKYLSETAGDSLGFYGSSVFAESGISIPQGNDNRFIEKHPPGVQWAESNTTMNLFYNGAGITYPLSKKIILINAFNNVLIQNRKQIIIGPELVNDYYNIYQNQLYFSMRYRLSPKSVIIPSVNAIMLNYNTLISEFDSVKNKVVMAREDVAQYDFAGSLTYDVKFRYTGLSVNVLVSRMNNSMQKHLGLIFSVYPKGNLNFYTVTSLYLHNTGYYKHIIGEQILGFRLAPKIWSESFITFGNLENFSDRNAYVVYNVSDITRFSAGTSILLSFKRLDFSLRYRYMDKITYFDFFQGKTRTGNYTHSGFSLLGTATWKF